MAKDAKGLKAVFYGKVIFWCVIASVISWSMLGSHVEDADPLYGGGTRVTDYVPSDREKIVLFWKTLFILVVPAIIGSMKGLKTEKI